LLDSASLHSINPLQKNSIPKVKTQNLYQLIPHTYTTIHARVLVVKSKEKEDELGKRGYIFGLCEDATSRIPFICYKPYSSFFRDAVFKFEDIYVHEFEDKSLLLIITELSKIDYLIDEDPKKYVWNQQIGYIKRPMGTCRVTLQGILSQISSSSGLVQRCENCGRVTFEGKCPNGHENELFTAVRISGKLSDESGSINVVFSQQLACMLLGMTAGEILQLVEGQTPYSREFACESYTLQMPSNIELCEAYADAPDDYRSAYSPVVVDLNDSRIVYPNDLKPRETFGNETRKLDLNRKEDRRDLTRLIEKLIEIKIRKVTQLPKVNGILLTENPLSLYGTENAQLYIGFRTKTNVKPPTQLVLQILPTAEVYESVVDYVQYRRQRGASTNSIRNSIINYRRNVILAPGGELATIVDLKFMKAGDFKVPLYDFTLPEFWKKIHDVTVSQDESPLVVTKPYRLDLELTFPPSCVFFDKQSIRIGYGPRGFVNRKRQDAKSQAKLIVDEALKDFSIGTFKLTPPTGSVQEMDTREVLLANIRERLLGKRVKATGSVIEAQKQLYFIPRTVERTQ